MTRRDASLLAVRILGLYLIVGAVFTLTRLVTAPGEAAARLTSLYPSVRAHDLRHNVLVLWSVSAAYRIIVVALFWAAAARIGRLLFRSDEADRPLPPMTASGWLSTILLCYGIWTLVPDLPMLLASLLFRNRQVMHYAVSGGTGVLIGACFAFCSVRLARWAMNTEAPGDVPISRDAAVMGIRFVAVYTGLQVILQAQDVIYPAWYRRVSYGQIAASEPGWSFFALSFVVTLVVGLGLAALLWRCAEPISRLLGRGLPEPESSESEAE